MKHVLVYGDSQTWGTNPESKGRYPWGQRWPGVMAESLGGEWAVIEQGLRGRTTTADNPHRPGRSGAFMLPMLLESHAPLDVVVLMLGTNDISRVIGRTAVDAAFGCAGLIDIIQHSGSGPDGGAPKIVLVAPPPICQSQGRMELLYDGREAESNRLDDAYALVARRFGATFFDAGDVAHASEADGVHPDKAANRKLGQHLAACILRLFDPDARPVTEEADAPDAIAGTSTGTSQATLAAEPANQEKPLP